ncbi:MAG: mechanosensitive ion channel family protein [Hapalosiphonaceae cyanobacterium JJU2]|nr:MAG: mechanosensitive ion channel family protein [Hapalosiphonaceae cyanobacterium JJU2]
MPQATAQIPFIPNLQPPNLRSSDSDNRTVTGWVYLDGRRLFQITAPRANITERLENIQQNLDQISQNYFQNPDANLDVQVKTENGLPVIYVNNRQLLTITDQDARLRQVDALTLAKQISESLQEQLEQARQEREPEFLVRQGAIAVGCGLTILAISWGLTQWKNRSQRLSIQQQLASATASPTAKPITLQLNKQQQTHIQEVQKRLHQIAQVGIWGGGGLFVLGLFPYTRSLQLGIFLGLQIPVKLGVVAIGTYVAVRLSYVLIDRFTSALVSSSALLTPETSERLQLRVSTISGVTKSIVTIVWLGVGILFALVSLGIDVVPLLAGAGLVGVAVSLASQNLIKDAINGFLIILEDQYALGDVISVGTVGGLVENLNLRMTQVRDAEGRLITIPNSEIKIVANLSSRWSRADLTIPVDYQTDIDKALNLIKKVALDMDNDPEWQHKIVETPQVLGIDNFGDRGLLIRVWIKTQPLKQWDVAREFRRRLKIAFDHAGISIPVPQQAIWVNDGQMLVSSESRIKEQHSTVNGH